MVVIIQSMILIPMLVLTGIGIYNSVKELFENMKKDGEEDGKVESN